jgi:hypothetical protein
MTADRRRLQPVAFALVLGGLLLVPWTLYLAGALPHTTRARNWSLMWTGLDIAEAVGLALTGVLLWRRSRHRALPAAFTAALLAADAWIDVTTSAPGHARTLAIVMAALIEIPAAAGCLVLAVRALPRVPAEQVPGTADVLPVPTAPAPTAPARI